jgi:hypothetical protein
MSSSIDSGAQENSAYKQSKSKCVKSPTGKHKWIRIQDGPSAWDKCKYCKQDLFWK